MTLLKRPFPQDSSRSDLTDHAFHSHLFLLAKMSSFYEDLSLRALRDALPWWTIWAVLALVIVPPLAFIATYASVVEKRPWRHRTATVLVLGDIGRSPRMMYHAESLAKSGWDTYMVGYGGKKKSRAH